jgi:hypothetical protein
MKFVFSGMALYCWSTDQAEVRALRRAEEREGEAERIQGLRRRVAIEVIKVPILKLIIRA